MSAGADGGSREERLTTTTTLVVAAAMTMARTGAGVPHHWGLGFHILSTPVPVRYRPPMNVHKYTWETNPDLWLEDYRLAYQTRGIDSDAFIIHNLPCTLPTQHEHAWGTFRPTILDVGRT
jgi:hypothetical protein